MKKWSKKKKLIRNLMILLLLVAGIVVGEISLSGTYRDADTAHAASEATRHYGPSEIRAVLADVDGSKRSYLGVYDKWYSVDTVIKDWKGWRIGNHYGADEIDYQKPVNHSWHIYDDEITVYGIVCDPDIASVEIGLRYGEQMVYVKQEKLFDDMFLFTQKRYHQGNSNENEESVLAEIRGYDQNGTIIYSENT